MTIKYLTREDIKEIIEPAAAREGLTFGEFLEAGKEDTLVDANLRDLWLVLGSALVER